MPQLPTALLVCVALGALVPASEAQFTSCASGGQLGDAIHYTYDAPGSVGDFLVQGISVTDGPFPLSIVDPGNAGVLDLGLELLTFWQLGVIATPTGAVTYSLPSNPALHGQFLYGQAFTIDGVTLVPDEIGNRVEALLGLPQATHNTLGEVLVARQGHTVTALDGDRVLVAGGDRVNAAGDIVEAEQSWEIFDPKTNRFVGSPNQMSIRRSVHTATKLQDGRVLLVGGYQDESTGVATATCEVYDPVTDTTTVTAPMSVARSQHSATLLADGRVFVVGGAETFDLQDVFASLSVTHKSSEVYDPVADTWTPGPDLPLNRFAHTATLMDDGRVLIASGVEVDFIPFGMIPVPSFTNDCSLYNPTSNAYDAAPSKPGNAVAYAAATKMANGDVLFAGGADGDFVLLSFQVRADCWRFDGANWSPSAALNTPRAYAQLFTLPDGVLCMGGLKTVDLTTASGQPATEIERADALALGWTSTPSMSMLLPREVARGAVLDGGQRVLTVGHGDDGDDGAIDKTAEIYFP